ncbi:MAG TPA: transporter substrate-binding domain-containing protein [Chitinophagales bacterium]|nr:transporter substrate-binding domain-containing protein [Chitinophagales bacterium]
MNRKITFFFCLMAIIGRAYAQPAQTDSLNVHYYENFPYAYMENGVLKGIEVDIIKKYAEWLKAEKNINTVITYKGFKEFSEFYNSIKKGRSNVIGLGSVTITEEREKEVAFSPPYLRNIAVLITNGAVPSIKTPTPEEVNKALGPLDALAVNESSHMKYMSALKASYLPSMQIKGTETQTAILDEISKGEAYGYVDIVAYWAYIKKNKKTYLKIQKAFNRPYEYLGILQPFGASHFSSLNEFFESGFGFTSTKIYHEILDRYLGYEVLETLEIK